MRRRTRRQWQASEHRAPAPRRAEAGTARAGGQALAQHAAVVLGGWDRPREPATCGLMEQRFGSDFGRVRIHTDAEAAESAGRLGAEAYMVGQDVVFAAGRYAPR
jgi:hypothetical protein